MRKQIVLLFISISLILPLSALGFVGDYKIWLDKERLADTMDELVSQYDSTACQNCHADIYEQWKESYHSKSIVSSAKSIGTFLTVGIQSEWGREINRMEAAKCLGCHIPMIHTATERLAKEIANYVIVGGGKKKGATEKEKKEALDQLGRLNINCVICHNMVSIMASPAYLEASHRWEGTEFVKTPNENDRALGITAKVFGAHENPDAPHEVVKTNGMTHSLFCEQCHGIWPSPDGERIQCNSLSGNYEDAYRTRGGWKQCQDCHMREKNRGHRMPGGHDFNGIVKESMSLNVSAVGLCRLEDNKTKGPWHPAAVVNVGIVSHAGHRIPDG